MEKILKIITTISAIFILNESLFAANAKSEKNSSDLIIEDAPAIFLGKEPTNSANVLGSIQFGITPDDIKNMKLKQEEILEAQEKKLVDYSGSIKKIVYKEGFIDIVLRLGYTTLINFHDDFGNNLEIETFAIGEENINLKKISSNQLILSPTKKYFSTNMIVMIKGYNKPVHIKISESLTATPNTELNVLIPSSFEITPLNKEDTYTANIELKRKITLELLKYNEIVNSKKVTFKAIDMKSNKEISSMELFNKVRFFEVERANKKFLIAEIDNQYAIVGNSYASFSRYNNTKSIYFLDDKTNILMITNKRNDYSEDVNFIEQKGFNDFNEFKRIKIILNK